jgi:hypothetical protein
LSGNRSDPVDEPSWSLHDGGMIATNLKPALTVPDLNHFGSSPAATTSTASTWTSVLRGIGVRPDQLVATVTAISCA